MFRFHASRRLFVACAVVCCLGIITLAAVTQAMAARRGWGGRRGVYRAPATTTPSPTPASRAPATGTPTPAIPRPEPPPALDSVTASDDSWQALVHTPDRATVLQEILEIRRRIRLDPALGDFDLRDLTGVGSKETVSSALFNHEQTSDEAFKQALESVGGDDAEMSVCKASTGRTCDTICRVISIQPEPEDVAEASTCAALRSAARVLDTRASDCEDARAYTRADELREIARQLRQEARRGGQGQVETGAWRSIRE